MDVQNRHWMAAIAVAAGLHLALLFAIPVPRETTVVGAGGGVRVALGEAVGPRDGGGPAQAVEVPPPPRAVEPPPPPRPAERAVPVAKASPRPAPKPVAKPAPPRAKSAEAPAAAVATPGGAAGEREGERVASLAAGSSTGSSAAPSRPGERGIAGLDPAYVRRFMASLERHKHYPRAARAQRLEGTTRLWLRLDRSGRVLAHRIEKSSGHRVLDRAVLRALEQAKPLPALPASYPESEIEMVIPVAFELH